MSDQDQGRIMSDQGKSASAEDEFGFEVDADLLAEELAGSTHSVPLEEAPDSTPAEPGKGQSGGNGLLIGGGVLILVLMLSGVGYMAMSVLGGGKPASGPSPSDFAQHSSQPTASSAAGFGTGEASMEGSGWGNDAGSPVWDSEPAAAASGFGSNTSAATFSDATTSVRPGAVTDNPQLAATNLAGQETAMLPSDLGGGSQARAIDITHGAPESLDTLALSEEELMYDQLLQRADQIEAPAEAIVIDQSVIQRQMNSRRLQELESQVEASRSSLGNIQEAIGDMAQEVKSLAEVVKQSSSSQKQLSERVDQLTQTVEAINSQTDLTEVKGLINRIADQATNAQRTANRALENSGGAAPVATPSAPASAPRSASVASASPSTSATPPPPAPAKAAPAPKPMAPVQASAAVVATTTPQAAPASCDVSTVSNLWSVKGVNATSAYVVRKSDKAGVFLRSGIEVPGFGTVVSFNPTGRFICTTSGMIGR